jgi:hypothetical protein
MRDFISYRVSRISHHAFCLPFVSVTILGREGRLGGVVMAFPEAEIATAIDAIKQAAAPELTITRSAVLEIERQVALIVGLTKSAEVKQEGAYLVSVALGRYTNRDNKPEIVRTARLHGAIARFEFALRQMGFLPPEEAQPTQAKPPRDAAE